MKKCATCHRVWHRTSCPELWLQLRVFTVIFSVGTALIWLFTRATGSGQVAWWYVVPVGGFIWAYTAFVWAQRLLRPRRELRTGGDEAAKSWPRSPEDVEPPPFPPERLAEAAAKPGGWVYEIRPGIDPDGRVVVEVIRGAWAVDLNGRPTGEYKPNPSYRRS